MFYVKYVKNCGAHIKEFKTKEDAMRFVANYKLKYQGQYNEDDHWIDLIFQGTIIFTDDSLEA